MKRKLIYLTFVLCLGTIATHAQEKKSISGFVKDSTGNGIGGVTVSVKGSKDASVTNNEGKFSMRAADKAVLIFSYVGYERQQVSLNGNADLTVTLNRKSGQLNEVVVTALGIKKSKERVSYATQEIKGATLTAAPETNVAENLVGKVAGLSIFTKSTMFESPDIYLRGGKTLIVVDGAPTDINSFNFYSIDPNTIDNITVLKGTAAAALYGSDGINGAIMVTTKTGKSGANGLEISVNSSNQFQGGFLRLPKTQTQYGTGTEGYYGFVDGYNGGGDWGDKDGNVWGPKLNQKDPSTASGYLEIPQYNSPYDPNTSYSFTDDGYPPGSGSSHYKPIPWISRGTHNLTNFLNNEFVTTDNITVASKSDKAELLASITNQYQKGQVPNTKFNNTTFTITGTLKVTDKLKIQSILSYNRQNSPNYPANATNAVSGGGSGANDYFYNIILWMGADVDIRDLRNYWKPEGPDIKNPLGANFGTKNIQQFNYNYSYYQNPYFVAYENLNSYIKDNITGQLSGTYSFNKDLNLLVRSAVSTYNLFTDDKIPWSFLDGHDIVQPYGGYSMEQTASFQIISNALLTYKKTFLSDFNATLSLGGETRYNRSTDLSQGTVGGLTIPDYYNLAASRGGPATASNSLSERQSSGVYSYADIDYKSMVYLGLTARNDWVTNLPKPNNSFFYPSANIGLVISKMVKLPDIVSYFKLRGSWSRVSNNNLAIPGYSYYQNTYASLATYNNGTRWNGNPSLSYPGTLIPPGLKPNTTISQEYGTEMSFFKNRLGIDVTYYNYDLINQINQATISPASGFDNLLVNGGNNRNKGVEIVARYSAIRNKNFRWDIAANWDEQHFYQGAYYGGTPIENEVAVGERTDLLKGKTWETDGHGNLVYNENGQLVATPYEVPIGHTDPKWEFGLTNTFTYKRLSVKISVDGRIGGILYDGAQAQLYNGGNAPEEVNSYRDDAYQHKNTYLPAGVVATSGDVTYDPQTGKITSDTRKYTANTTKVNYIDWIAEGSTALHKYGSGFMGNEEIYSRTFVKLREILISYDFNSNLLTKAGIKAATVSVTGRNLFLWTKVPGVDPDGYTGYSLPEPSYRNIGVNLNFKF
jgi:TonB-linked SusC/RagA family outer membrane protein